MDTQHNISLRPAKGQFPLVKQVIKQDKESKIITSHNKKAINWDMVFISLSKLILSFHHKIK